MSTVLGLAIAIIKELNANNRNTFKTGFSLVKRLFEPLNPCVELIFNVADCWFLFQNIHAAAIGIKRNNQKNSGFKKVSFPIIVVLFEVRLNSGFFLKFRLHIYHLLRER